MLYKYSLYKCVIICCIVAVKIQIPTKFVGFNIKNSNSRFLLILNLTYNLYQVILLVN
jgi:hypothetical protein